MDLLFKRYASPFLFIDNLIASQRFLEFVIDIIETSNEEKIYDIWLHKVFDKTLEDFKEEIKMRNQVFDNSVQKVEATIKNSFEIMNNFTPV